MSFVFDFASAAPTESYRYRARREREEAAEEIY